MMAMGLPTKIGCLFLLHSLVATTVTAEKKDTLLIPFAMSFDELMDLRFDSSAALTRTKNQVVPAAITTISAAQIRRSGARSLDELLEIAVPGLQIMNKDTSNQLGIRGIISDRNTKFLLLVNGRIMNGRTAPGAQSERFISMLGDIERIEVVRGPGSAIYGPGALAGVISITTYTGFSFDGVEVNIRQGLVEKFSTIEFRYGKKIGHDSGLFIYYGVDNYRGADQDDAPVIFSGAFTSGAGEPVAANKAVDFAVSDQGRAYRNQVRHKFHLHYSQGGFDSWLRYTRGGSAVLVTRNSFIRSDPEELLDKSFGYQQLTFLTRYTHRVSDALRLDYRLSFDKLDTEINPVKSFAEDEYHARILANWDPAPQHAFAFGVEYSHEIFGKDSPGFPDEPAFINGRLRGTPSWNTDTYSLMMEYQWQMNDEITVFLGSRGDNHRYTNWLISPRLSLVYTPSAKDTVKLLFNRSVRRSDDADLREKFLASRSKGDGEEIDVWELRYESKRSDQLWLAASGYYSDYDVVAFNGSAQDIADIGRLKYYGLEWELKYQGYQWQVSFSHNYTKLIDFDLADVAITVQNISANAYGYGDDLENWSNHSSKLSVEYNLSAAWKAMASLRYLWGYPGGEDMAQYNREVLGNNTSLPVQDISASDRAFEQSVYLNLGVEFIPRSRTTLQLDAFNVLGWIDKDLNKRNQFQRSGGYRNEAAAISISAKFDFR